MANNTPHRVTKEDQASMDQLIKLLPWILRIIVDLSDERYERLEQLTEESRIIRDRIGV
jgi:hypothetical protein